MKNVLNILYHRINDVPDDIYGLAISTDEFEQHMKFIKDNYYVARFEDSWETLDEDAVVVTFDDGYADNYVYALPILQKYRIPATIFVSSGNIDSKREFWWDELGRQLTESIQYPADFSLDDPLYQYTWSTITLEERRELAKTLRWLLLMEPNNERYKNWIDQLKQWRGIDSDEGREEYLSLNMLQLRALSDSDLITIGAHTIRHPVLSALSYEDQKKEIAGSIHHLNKWLGKEIGVFSYPFGLYNGETLSICKELNLKKAATTKEALWNENMSQHEIPRVTIRNGNVETFKNTIIKFMER